MPAKLPQSSSGSLQLESKCPGGPPMLARQEAGWGSGQRESEPGAQPPSSSTAWRLWGGGRRAEMPRPRDGRGKGAWMWADAGMEEGGGGREGEAGERCRPGEGLLELRLTSESLLPDIRKSSKSEFTGLCRSDRLHPLKVSRRYYRVCAWRNWGDRDYCLCVLVPKL